MVLKFPIPSLNIGENIQLMLDEFLKVLGLDDDSITRYIVLDNAANNRRAMTLSNLFTAFYCCIHTIQLSVNGCLKATVNLVSVTTVVKKCRELTTFIRRSEHNINTLKKACKEAKIKFILPVKANDTRWDSTVANITSVIRVQPALHSIVINDEDPKQEWTKYVMNYNEVKAAESLIKTLACVKTATKLWQGRDERCVKLNV